MSLGMLPQFEHRIAFSAAPDKTDIGRHHEKTNQRRRRPVVRYFVNPIDYNDNIFSIGFYQLSQVSRSVIPRKRLRRHGWMSESCCHPAFDRSEHLLVDCFYTMSPGQSHENRFLEPLHPEIQRKHRFSHSTRTHNEQMLVLAGVQPLVDLTQFGCSVDEVAEVSRCIMYIMEELTILLIREDI